MDIVKAFADNEASAEINIQGTHDSPLFQANQIGKLLGIVNIRSTISDFDNDERRVDTIYTSTGLKETIFLTELGLYRLLGMSRKPVARKFQKWVATVLKEIRITGRYEADESMKQQIEENNSACQLQIDMSRHKTLIEAYSNKNGVYVGKVHTFDDDTIVIKIGNTSDIKQRASNLKNTFGTFMLMEFVPCNRHIALETAILKHPTIADYAYTEPINETISTETFRIPKDYYSEVIATINLKAREYTDDAFYQIELAEKQQKILDTQLEITNRNIDMLRLQAVLPPTHVIERVVTVEEVPQPIPFTINERRLNSRGSKIQKYTLEGVLVATFSGMRDATRKEPGSSDNGIKSAILNNTIYHEHRWMFLDRSKDDNTIQDIGECVAVRVHNSGFVAMLNIDKTHIVHVFPDQKSAGRARQFSSAGAISQAIKLNRLCSGHYFCYYDDCSDDLKNAYLQHSELPGEPARCNSVPIKQLHPITRVLIKTYNSIADVQKEYQASRITLKKVIDESSVFKGFVWSY